MRCIRVLCLTFVALGHDELYRATSILNNAQLEQANGGCPSI